MCIVTVTVGIASKRLLRKIVFIFSDLSLCLLCSLCHHERAICLTASNMDNFKTFFYPFV